MSRGSNLFRNDYESPVGVGVLTGRKRNQFISVCRIHTGVIELTEMDTIHEVCKVLFIHIRVLIVSEGVVVRIKTEDRYDLILSEAEQGIKLDDRVLVVEVLAGVIAEIVEHRLIFHVVPVDHIVVALTEHTILVNIGNTIITVLLFKAVLQIVIRIEPSRCATACQGAWLWHSFFAIKRSGNQVLKIVLLNHHKITIKQDRHCHHYENNTIYGLVFQALLL